METIDKNIIVCGVPQYDFVQTADRPKTTPIMNDINNKNDSVPTTEQPTATEKLTNLIIELACGRGSRIVSSLTKINDYVEIGLNRKADHAYYNLARNISKRLFENPTDRAIESVCNTLELSASVIINAVNEIKQTAKPRTRGIIDMACMNYSVGVIRGDVLKNARVAKNCKDLALKLLVNPNFDVNDLLLSIDTLANKVYASVRSQATKNGESFSKSNTATKNAVKTALIETIEALRLEHGTEYEILIDNMPKQPKHLSI